MATTTTTLNLEQHRRNSGISLERISGETKIGTNFLRAIESEEFEKLPGGVFNTSYIRQYAAAIGFSQDKLLQFYHDRMAAMESEEASATSSVTQNGGGIKARVSWLRLPLPLFRS